MSEKPSKRIKRAVKSWFSKEGAKVETISNPRAEFLFKVKYQRFFFTIVRPNERKFIQLESQVIISPQHLKILSQEKMREFQIEALKFSFTQGVNLGFIKPRPDQQGPKPPGPGFVVSDRIYDDGFSEDRLWAVMRRLHSTVDMSIALLNEITGQRGMKPPTETTDSGPSYYT
ncbi:MAG: DUF2299 family protein [Candidatus Thorarchaeota archaeon]